MMGKQWPVCLLLMMIVVGCVPIQQPATAEQPQQESVFWEVLPGGETDSPEYLYDGPDRSDEDCVQITVEAQQLPAELEVYVQTSEGRFAIDLVPWLEQGVKTVQIPLSQLMLKDPTFGHLDPDLRFAGGELEYAGIRAFDGSRQFHFTVTQFVFFVCSEGANL